ncbi:hypothetical protein DF050_22325 [Burkholderia cepacia]|nr:hypothetical protein WK70_00605 [Burkholderia cepacia]RQT49012.1 hypothetical protein DF050_22325 [Burkholderia cepacia]
MGGACQRDMRAAPRPGVNVSRYRVSVERFLPLDLMGAEGAFGGTQFSAVPSTGKSLARRGLASDLLLRD